MRLLLALALLLGVAQPALAHRLKVFATVEGGAVSGYAFFVGGGRAKGALWVATLGGQVLAEGRTDDAGGFRLMRPAGLDADLTVTVNTEEGHIAKATLTPARLGAAVPVSQPALQPAAAAAARQADPPAEALARLVEAAVQRQVQPLQAQIEAMDSRLRLVDVMSGLFLILGLAGAGLWLRGRRGNT